MVYRLIAAGRALAHSHRTGYGCHTQNTAPANQISAPLKTSPYLSTAPSRRRRAPALEPTQSSK
jgi:hypothetical protein